MCRRALAATGSAAYSVSTTNNGNLLQRVIAAPRLNVTQTYAYDNLNRLSLSRASFADQGERTSWRLVAV